MLPDSVIPITGASHAVPSPVVQAAACNAARPASAPCQSSAQMARAPGAGRDAAGRTPAQIHAAHRAGLLRVHSNA
jgi:hypothetical protein